ncbi:hypothetical protein WJX74_003784 [Apatococcus lobatus]|uniref:Uncharacterized protein n=1 Tax=Apatococcus lobatus TaxID=904363 RepID=A0AAW1RSI9_9CHLO
MASLLEVQHLIISKSFFQAVSRLADDPVRKGALYSACCGLLQKQSGGQETLTHLLAEAKLAAECLCRDISARPQNVLQNLVYITATIFGHEQAAEALQQHEHALLLQTLGDFFRSTHDRVLARQVICALCRIHVPAAAATSSFPVLFSAALLALHRPNPWASVQCAMYGLSLLKKLAELSPAELAASRCEWMPSVWHCLLASPLSEPVASPTIPLHGPQNGLPGTDGKKWSGNRHLRQQARDLLSTSLQAPPGADSAAGSASPWQDLLKQHLSQSAPSSKGPGLMAMMQQIMEKPSTAEGVALRQSCKPHELQDLEVSALQACRIFVQQLGMHAGDLRSFGRALNQMLTIISAGLRRQVPAVVAALAAICQLGPCLLRGSSPWKSAALLTKAVVHVMQQRQLHPEVAQEVKRCWTGLLHAAVSAPESSQYKPAVAAVMEPVLRSCCSRSEPDLFANFQRLHEVLVEVVALHQAPSISAAQAESCAAMAVSGMAALQCPQGSANLPTSGNTPAQKSAAHASRRASPVTPKLMLPRATPPKGDAMATPQTAACNGPRSPTENSGAAGGTCPLPPCILQGCTHQLASLLQYASLHVLTTAPACPSNELAQVVVQIWQMWHSLLQAWKAGQQFSEDPARIMGIAMVDSLKMLSLLAGTEAGRSFEDAGQSVQILLSHSAHPRFLLMLNPTFSCQAPPYGWASCF